MCVQGSVISEKPVNKGVVANAGAEDRKQHDELATGDISIRLMLV